MGIGETILDNSQTQGDISRSPSMPFETSRSQRFRNKLQAFMTLVESTPGLSNLVRLEPNLKFASYMAPKGLQYCDIMLRVPLSAAEI